MKINKEGKVFGILALFLILSSCFVSALPEISLTSLSETDGISSLVQIDNGNFYVNYNDLELHGEVVSPEENKIVDIKYKKDNYDWENLNWRMPSSSLEEWWSSPLHGTFYSEGIHSVCVNAIDELENEGEECFNLCVDLQSPNQISEIANGGVLAFNWQSPEDSGCAGIGNYLVEVYGEVEGIIYETNTANNFYIINSEILTDGNSYFIRVSPLDKAGNSQTFTQSQSFIYEEIQNPVCPNNIIESGEVCDGTSLNSQTCITQGFYSGTLSCLPDCSGYDTSACISLQDFCSSKTQCSDYSQQECNNDDCDLGCIYSGSECVEYIAPDTIIADHTVVDLYDTIPQYWIDEVKKMLLVVYGESHGDSYRVGQDALELLNPLYSVQTSTNLLPTGNNTYLRVSELNGGEEDFYTSSSARTTTSNFLQSNAISAFGFGWCWDMTWLNSPGGTIDPVYNVHWAGASVGGPEGNLIWGLDEDDVSLTGNSVTMETYINAVEQYNLEAPDTITFFTTGPVDSYANSESGYQRYLKHEYIRNYVSENGGYLFDYADILCWDGDVETTGSWNGHTFQQITPTNLGDGSIGHIGEEGAIRIAKAMWWMLARMAGWDGNPVIEAECNNTGDCPDLECNSKECINSQCVYSNLVDGTNCSNGLFCDGADTCQSGICVSLGNPCEEDEYSCTTNTCNEIFDQCDLSMENSICDDNNVCTLNDRCVGEGGDLSGCLYDFANSSVSCNDLYSCTENDVCDGQGSCTGAPNNELCLQGFESCASAVCDPSLYPLTGCGNYNPFGCEEASQINYDNENLVSLYLFNNANDLGADYKGNNLMSIIYPGSLATNNPTQSTDVPSGFSGYSIDLDGAGDSVCIASDATFNPSQSHTVCWWVKPDSLDTREQFAQYQNYDSWVISPGNYRWATKNLVDTWNNLDVSSVYTVGQWTHVCNKYDFSTLTKTVYVNGNPSGTQIVGNGIRTYSSRWCIGSYGTGSFLNGKIFQPVWFNKSLTSEEINQVYSDF